MDWSILLTVVLTVLAISTGVTGTAVGIWQLIKWYQERREPKGGQ